VAGRRARPEGPDDAAERARLSTIEAVSRNLRAVTAACRTPKTRGADAGSSQI
jgi:hypothetical protein